MRLAIKNEYCVPNATVRELGFRERATPDEFVWSGSRYRLFKLAAEYAELKGCANAFNRKVGRNVQEYLV